MLAIVEHREVFVLPIAPRPGVPAMSDWQDEYLTMLDDCEHRESRLSDWERGFVDSLRAWIESGKRPSPKQVETLDNVWEKATAKG